jgi:hypothetical protein
VQVFNLSILPGTAFRQEAASLGLKYQPRPPYYVVQTQTLDLQTMFQLMLEAQETFEIEFDPFPPPVLEFVDSECWTGRARGSGSGPIHCWRLDLDENMPIVAPPPENRSLTFTLWLRARDFHARGEEADRIVAGLLLDNPHTTLQLVLEPTGDPRALTLRTLDRLTRACHQAPSYLDRYYSLQPGRPLGAKRLIVVVPLGQRDRLGPDWLEAAGEFATVVWRGRQDAALEVEAYEYVME